MPGDTVKFPEELPRNLVTCVDENSPAFAVLKRICSQEFRPGQVIPCTAEELESLKHDTLILEVK